MVKDSVLVKSNGFTMIEMLAALAVIVVLVLVALPNYQRYVAMGEIDRCIKFITPSRMTADNLIQIDDGSATGVTAATLELSGNNNCDSIAVNGAANGGMTIAGTINTSSGSNTMTLTRVAADGTWTCSSSNASLSPASCP